MTYLAKISANLQKAEKELGGEVISFEDRFNQLNKKENEEETVNVVENPIKAAVGVDFSELLKNKIGSVDKDKIKFEVSENTVSVSFKNTEGEISAAVTAAKKGRADTAVKVTLSADIIAKGKTPEEVIGELTALFQAL